MTGRVAYSVKNPELAGPHDYGDEFVLPTQGGAVDFDYFDALDETYERQHRATSRQTVLELFGELEERGKGYLERARARAALADYLRHTVAPAYPAARYAALADALDNARKHGLWGVGEIWKPINADGTMDVEPALAVKWTGRAGQVKLCPDDAREDSMRASSLYAQRIAELADEGFAVRYAVFTIPNSPAGFLRADLKAVFDRFIREILFARADGGPPVSSVKDKRRKFPSLRGALAVLEAPLSARGDWNVHLNVIMVFSDFPPYKELRAAWGANVEFRNVPAGAEKGALTELIKYPLKAVSLKSEEKGAAGSRAPPVIQWPADAFHEWWTAHRGFRRARSWGELYAGSLPDDERDRIMPHTIEWLGKVYNSAARFYAQRSMPDTTALDERQRDRRQRELFTPPSPQLDFDELQRLQHRAAFHADSELAEATAAAVAARIDLILGDKSAEGAQHTGADPPLD